MITLVLMIIATVCLFLAAFNVPVSNPNLGWFGMACWALATVLPHM